MPRERVNSQHLTFRIGFCHKKYAYQEKGTRDRAFSPWRGLRSRIRESSPYPVLRDFWEKELDNMPGE